jgi:hypothetical protein
MLPFRQGKRKPECCALFHLAFYPNSPAITFRQFLTQYQSQSRALFTRCAKIGVLHVDPEEFRNILNRDSYAGISDSYSDYTEILVLGHTAAFS